MGLGSARITIVALLAWVAVKVGKFTLITMR